MLSDRSPLFDSQWSRQLEHEGGAGRVLRLSSHYTYPLLLLNTHFLTNEIVGNDFIILSKDQLHIHTVHSS